jgi:hypothetical protein
LLSVRIGKRRATTHVIIRRDLSGYYGSYAADESAKTLTFHIEHATFPQWDGINRTATIELLTGDKLRIANSVVHDPKLGDIVPHLDWQRIK